MDSGSNGSREVTHAVTRPGTSKKAGPEKAADAEGVLEALKICDTDPDGPDGTGAVPIREKVTEADKARELVKLGTADKAGVGENKGEIEIDGCASPNRKSAVKSAPNAIKCI